MFALNKFGLAHNYAVSKNLNSNTFESFVENKVNRQKLLNCFKIHIHKSFGDSFCNETKIFKFQNEEYMLSCPSNIFLYFLVDLYHTKDEENDST